MTLYAREKFAILVFRMSRRGTSRARKRWQKKKARNVSSRYNWNIRSSNATLNASIFRWHKSWASDCVHGAHSEAAFSAENIGEKETPEGVKAGLTRRSTPNSPTDLPSTIGECWMLF